MNYYFVDYASVGTHGLDGIERLTENDTVYVFYNAFTSKLTFDNSGKICESPSKFNYVGTDWKIFSNPVAIRIAVTVGYCIAGKNEDDRYFLVTGRLSLSNIDEFAEEHGVELDKTASLSDAADIVYGVAAEETVDGEEV